MSQLSAGQLQKVEAVKQTLNITFERAKYLLNQSDWNEDRAVDNYYSIGSTLFQDFQEQPPAQQPQPQPQNIKTSQQQQNPLFPNLQQNQQIPNQMQPPQQPNVPQRAQVPIVNQQPQASNNNIPQPQEVFNKLHIRQLLNQIIDLEWEFNSESKLRMQIVQASMLQQRENEVCNKFRTFRNPVGLYNYGEMGYYNCVVQIVLSNPVLIELILKNQEKSNVLARLADNLQVTTGQLHFSNQAFLVSKKLSNELLNLQKHIQQFALVSNSKTGCKQFLKQFLQIIDMTLDNRQDNILQLKEDISTRDIIDQYMIELETITTKSKMFFEFERSDKLFYFSLYKMIEEEQIKKFKKLPKNLLVSVENRDENSRLSEYWMPQKMHLGFLFQRDFVQKLSDKLSIKEEQIAKINNLRSDLNALRIVINDYQKQKVKPRDVVSRLKQEQDKLEQDQNSNILKSLNNFGLQNLNLYEYTLQTVVIQYTHENQRHNFLYAFNFFLKKWFKINDTVVEIVQQEEVLNNAQLYGVLFLYVNSEQKQQVEKFQETLNDLAYKLEATQGILPDYFQTEIMAIFPFQQKIIQQIDTLNNSFYKRINQKN